MHYVSSKMRLLGLTVSQQGFCYTVLCWHLILTSIIYEYKVGQPTQQLIMGILMTESIYIFLLFYLHLYTGDVSIFVCNKSIKNCRYLKENILKDRLICYQFSLWKDINKSRLFNFLSECLINSKWHTYCNPPGSKPNHSPNYSVLGPK
jgi:hypothetical protein